MVHQRSFSRQALPTFEPPKTQPSAPVQALPPPTHNSNTQLTKRFRDFIKRLKPIDYFSRFKRTHLSNIQIRKPRFSSPRIYLRNSISYAKMHPFRALLLAFVLILSIVSLARAADIDMSDLKTSEELPYPLSRMHYATIPRKRKSWKSILGGHLRRDFVVERKEGEVGAVVKAAEVVRGLMERALEGMEH